MCPFIVPPAYLQKTPYLIIMSVVPKEIIRVQFLHGLGGSELLGPFRLIMPLTSTLWLSMLPLRVTALVTDDPVVRAA